MRKKNNSANQLKHCPFVDEKCLGSGCMIFHEQFQRCGIDLMGFNTFVLGSKIQQLTDLLPEGGK